MSALGYKDVCKLDVTVNNTFKVGCLERVRGLNAQREHFLHVQRFARDKVLERHATKKLHDNKCLGVSFDDFIGRADVGMVQGRSLRLAFERASFPAPASSSVAIAKPHALGNQLFQSPSQDGIPCTALVFAGDLDWTNEGSAKAVLTCRGVPRLGN